MISFPVKGRSFFIFPSLCRFSTLFHISAADEGCADAAADETLITSVVSILQSQRSRSRWNFLKKSLPHHHTFTPSQLSSIVLRLRNTPHLALTFFEWTAANHFISPDDLTSRATLIHVLARRRLRTAALSVIRSCTDYSIVELLGALSRTYRECDSSPVVFDLVLRACVESKRIEEALAVVRVLKSRGIFPENRTCCEIITLVSDSRGSDRGFEVYRGIFGNGEDGGGIGKRSRGWKPNNRVFNALLMAVYRDGTFTEKKSMVFSEMERFGCEWNSFTYCILMAAYVDQRMVDRARGIWEEMRSKGIKPDLVAYNILMGGLCEAGDVLKAEELFTELVLEGNGVDPTCTTYEHLVKGHCKNGDIDAAVLVYNDMNRKGFQPEGATVEILLVELCGKGRVMDGLRIFRNELGREGFHPSRQCYLCLIKGFCNDGKMAEALRLQAEMVGKGFEPDAAVYDAFIRGYMEVGEVEKAGRLREEMSEFGLLKLGEV